jgi:hypothetical protein
MDSGPPYPVWKNGLLKSHTLRIAEIRSHYLKRRIDVVISIGAVAVEILPGVRTVYVGNVGNLTLEQANFNVLHGPVAMDKLTLTNTCSRTAARDPVCTIVGALDMQGSFTKRPTGGILHSMWALSLI